MNVPPLMHVVDGAKELQRELFNLDMGKRSNKNKQN